VSIDLSKVTAISDDYGVITQITDSSGCVIWSCGKPVILEVAKITSNTYAGETTYENEEFILLNIYPKTNGTVKVTYGGLTKTITDTSGAEEPNAQQVFFGIFNGVADEVATPASGELVIEGDYKSFSVGSYSNNTKGVTIYCGCITAVNDWGNTVNIMFSAFYNCTSLESIVIPDSVTDIGYSAFNGCTSLVSIVIPDSVTGIGASAFYKCTSLTSIVLSDRVTRIGDHTFNGCTSLTSIEIPNSVTSIGVSAFYKCTSLTSIVIPDSVTSIGDYAFYVCTSLESINIPEGVTSIGGCAFYGCTSLESNGKITLPSTLQTIYYSALSYNIRGAGGVDDYCWYFAEVTILATTPPSLIEDEVIQPGIYLKKIIVPKGCGEVYKSADGWAKFANYIVEAS
jgi:hypothetical protein